MYNVLICRFKRVRLESMDLFFYVKIICVFSVKWSEIWCQTWHQKYPILSFKWKVVFSLVLCVLEIFYEEGAKRLETFKVYIKTLKQKHQKYLEQK